MDFFLLFQFLYGFKILKINWFYIIMFLLKCSLNLHLLKQLSHWLSSIFQLFNLVICKMLILLFLCNIYISYLLFTSKCLARTPRVMLNNKDQHRYLCTVLDIDGKSLVILHLECSWLLNIYISISIQYIYVYPCAK